MRINAASPPRITAALFILFGLLMLGAGGWLAALGGSWYYLLAGIGLAASGVLLWRGRRLGVRLYGALWLLTVMWAFWEVGMDVWGLLPRVLVPTTCCCLSFSAGWTTAGR